MPHLNDQSCFEEDSALGFQSTWRAGPVNEEAASVVNSDNSLNASILDFRASASKHQL